MIRTVEAVVDASGRVQLLGEVPVDAPRRPLVTILEAEPVHTPNESALLAERSLDIDWSRTEAAWSNLQQAE